MDIKINLDWQINIAGESLINPVLFDLLTAIDKTGSLKQATEQINVSYRFAWGLLGKWEKALEQPLVILERGRGANLTIIGEKLLNAHLQLQAKFTPELDNFATRFKQEFKSLLISDDQASLNIFASHGLAIGSLRDLINQQNNFKLDLHFHGSLECLRALRKGECDIAGFHIPAGPMAKQLMPKYLEVLDQEQHQIIYVVKRNQGLIVQAGNPKNISSLSSLTQVDLRFINRQVDSGTRLLFDQLLQQEKIEPSHINGYNDEEFTHMAVAAMIASDAADVGFGIAPMAEKFNLQFLPLIWEHYCLAVPRSIAHDNRIAKIVELLQSDNFKQGLNNLSGYDTALTGTTIGFKKLFA